MNRTCPTHGTPLESGTIRFRCPAGHSVPAADLSHEFQSTTTPKPKPRAATIEHTLGKWCYCGEDTCAGWRAYVANRKLKADFADLQDVIDESRRVAS